MRLLILLGALVLSTVSQAAITVDNTIVHFASDQQRRDVVIHNPDAEPVYLDIEVFEIRHPGRENEQRISQKERDDPLLVASPYRMVVHPGQTRNLRLVRVAEPGDKETVMRVMVKPVAGRLQKSERSGVKILLGYDLLVFLAPREPNESLITERTGNRLHLANTGNVNVEFYRAEYCPVLGEGCEPLQIPRLYPGMTHDVTLPGDGKVELLYRSSTGSPQQRQLP